MLGSRKTRAPETRKPGDQKTRGPKTALRSGCRLKVQARRFAQHPWHSRSMNFVLSCITASPSDRLRLQRWMPCHCLLCLAQCVIEDLAGMTWQRHKMLRRAPILIPQEAETVPPPSRPSPLLPQGHHRPTELQACRREKSALATDLRSDKMHHGPHPCRRPAAPVQISSSQPPFDTVMSLQGNAWSIKKSWNDERSPFHSSARADATPC